MFARPLRRCRPPLALIGFAAACGGPVAAGSAARGAPVPRVPPPSRIEAVYVLESSGVPADDTVVTFPRAGGRVIILRRGAPDNSLFAEIAIPRDSSTADSVSVAIRPLPGRYGVELDAPGGRLGRARVIFSYGVHFVAPAGARARYGSDISFEQALLVARVETDGRVVFLPTTRPGSDMVAAPIDGPGRYVVAAPGVGAR